MMEEETHVVDNMSDHEGICQVLYCYITTMVLEVLYKQGMFFRVYFS